MSSRTKEVVNDVIDKFGCEKLPYHKVAYPTYGRDLQSEVLAHESSKPPNTGARIGGEFCAIAATCWTRKLAHGCMRPGSNRANINRGQRGDGCGALPD